MSHIVQSGIFPKLSLCSQIDLYFRNHQFANLHINDAFFSLDKFGKVSPDPYFNS